MRDHCPTPGRQPLLLRARAPRGHSAPASAARRSKVPPLPHLPFESSLTPPLGPWDKRQGQRLSAAGNRPLRPHDLRPGGRDFACLPMRAPPFLGVPPRRHPLSPPRLETWARRAPPAALAALASEKLPARSARILGFYSHSGHEKGRRGVQAPAWPRTSGAPGNGWVGSPDFWLRVGAGGRGVEEPDCLGRSVKSIITPDPPGLRQTQQTPVFPARELPRATGQLSGACIVGHYLHLLPLPPSLSFSPLWSLPASVFYGSRPTGALGCGSPPDGRRRASTSPRPPHCLPHLNPSSLRSPRGCTCLTHSQGCPLESVPTLLPPPSGPRQDRLAGSWLTALKAPAERTGVEAGKGVGESVPRSACGGSSRGPRGSTSPCPPSVEVPQVTLKAGGDAVCTGAPPPLRCVPRGRGCFVQPRR